MKHLPKLLHGETVAKKPKQDKKSENLICLSNRGEAAKSARQPQSRKLAASSVPRFNLLTLEL